MPFIKFKKDEVLTVGEHVLDLKLHFGEIEVVQENVDFIAMQILIESWAPLPHRCRCSR